MAYMCADECDTNMSVQPLYHPREQAQELAAGLWRAHPMQAGRF